MDENKLRNTQMVIKYTEDPDASDTDSAIRRSDVRTTVGSVFSAVQIVYLNTLLAAQAIDDPNSIDVRVCRSYFGLYIDPEVFDDSAFSRIEAMGKILRPRERSFVWVYIGCLTKQGKRKLMMKISSQSNDLHTWFETSGWIDGEDVVREVSKGS